MNKRHFLLSATLTVSIAACTPDTEPTRTVDWYQQHATERQERLQACRSNPGDFSGTPNCINAERAATRDDAGKRGTLGVQPMTDLKLGGK